MNEEKKEKLTKKIWDDIENSENYHEEWYADRDVLVIDGVEACHVIGVGCMAGIILKEDLLYVRAYIIPDKKEKVNIVYIHTTEAKNIDELMEAGYSFKDINKILKQKEDF